MKFFFLHLSFLLAPATAFVPITPAFTARAIPAVTSPTAKFYTITDEERTTKVPEFDEVCETTGVTLKRFMSEVALLNPELKELTSLMEGVNTACKALASLVKTSQLPSSQTLGYEGNVNIQGEDQKKLDVIANELLKRALRFTGRIGVLASEEEDNPVDVMPGTASEREIIIDDTDRYVAVFDPLDGSSNIDAGCPTGTIIGIYEHDAGCDVENSEDNCLSNTLQPGTKLVAAAYCLYSSSTFFALTLGKGVHMFALDEEIGEFILCNPNVKIPDTSSIISFNEANTHMWDAPMQETVSKWKEGKGKSGNAFSSRYIGAMVGDVHRTLLYGGVFGYPADTNSPNGKLRLLYEGAPMSFIVEQAGGLSTTGRERVMEIVPDMVHQRVPMVMGSKNDIQEVIEAYKEFDAK